MNPFDLRGPDFLLFYLGLVGFVALAVGGWWKFTDEVGEPTEFPSDPYLLAYLRGGRLEALRIALLTFFFEDAVSFDGSVIMPKEGDPKRPHAPLEAELWGALTRPRTLKGLNDELAGIDTCEKFRERLEHLGYLRDQTAVRAARAVVWAAIGFLVAVALVKIGLGISRHRPVALIVFLAMVVVVLGLKIKLSALTAKGTAVLTSVKALLDRSHVRALQDNHLLRDEELVMLAAAFGLGSLQLHGLPFLKALGGSPAGMFAAGSAGGTSSCGSSFSNTCSGSSGGSSCGSSCGGGCGGGGCGGCSS